MVVNIVLGVALFLLGLGVGYWIRQLIVQRRAGTIEARVEKMVVEAKPKAQQVLFSAKEKSIELVESAQKEEREHQHRLIELQQRLEKREETLYV